LHLNSKVVPRDDIHTQRIDTVTTDMVTTDMVTTDMVTIDMVTTDMVTCFNYVRSKCNLVNLSFSGDTI
jgi:hypothetical protein